MIAHELFIYESVASCTTIYERMGRDVVGNIIQFDRNNYVSPIQQFPFENLRLQ